MENFSYKYGENFLVLVTGVSSLKYYNLSLSQTIGCLRCYNVAELLTP